MVSLAQYYSNRKGTPVIRYNLALYGAELLEILHRVRLIRKRSISISLQPIEKRENQKG